MTTSMDPILLQWVIAGGAGLMVATTLTALSRASQPTRARVRGRLESIQDGATYTAPSDVDLLRSRTRIPFLHRFVRNEQSSSEVESMLERAGVSMRVSEYVALRGVAATGGVVLGLLIALAVGAAPLALIGIMGGAGVLGVLAPGFILRRRIARRRAQIERELVEMCDLMASMLQSGFGYLQALHSVSEQVEEPLAGELVRMRDQIRLGAGVDEALIQTNERLGSPDFDMVATAILIQRTSGGSLAPILAGVAKTIRDRHLFRAEIKALTSRERYSAVILASFPLLLTAALTAMLPDTFGLLFTDPTGRIVLAIAMASDALGYWFIKRVTRLEA